MSVRPAWRCRWTGLGAAAPLPHDPSLRAFTTALLGQQRPSIHCLSGLVTTFVTALYAIAGLSLYLVARFVNVHFAWGPFNAQVGGVWTAVVIVLVVGVPSLVAVLIGSILGAKTPRLTALFIQFWWLVALCLGGLLSVGALGVAVLVANAEGPKPQPESKVVLDQVAAIVAALVVLAAGGLGSSSRSWLSKGLIALRYAQMAQFQALPTAQPNLDAYLAITRESAGLSTGGSFTGWNRKDTVVRLKAIHAALWP